jgi:hypothetical protein
MLEIQRTNTPIEVTSIIKFQILNQRITKEYTIQTITLLWICKLTLEAVIQEK